MKCINSAISADRYFLRSLLPVPHGMIADVTLIWVRNLTSCTPLLATTACGPGSPVESIEAGLHSLSQVSSDSEECC